MKISVVEPNFHGHHLSYVSHLVSAASATNASTTVHMNEGAKDSKEFKNFLADADADVRFDLPKSTSGRLRTYRQTQQAITVAVKSDQPDVLIYPTADFAAVGNGLMRWLGPQALRHVGHSECMMTKIGYAYEGSQSPVLDIAERVGLRFSQWNRIGIIDVLAYQYHQRQNIQPERFRLYPDPISVISEPPDRSEARKFFDLDRQGPWLVCPGIIRLGKGIEQLLAAFEFVASKTDARLALIGPTRPDVKHLLALPQYERLIQQKRLVNVDQVLSEREVGLAILASDIVCCTYPKQNHPSSIAVKAIAYHRPVLCSNNYWIGKIGHDFQMGWVSPDLSRQSLSETMADAVKHAHDWRRSPAGDRLVAFQSAHNFRETWKDTLKQISGSSDGNCALPWTSVVDSVTQPNA